MRAPEELYFQCCGVGACVRLPFRARSVPCVIMQQTNFLRLKIERGGGRLIRVHA